MTKATARRLPRAVLLALCPGLVASAGAAGCNTNDPTYVPGDSVMQVDGTGTEAKQTLQLRFRTATGDEAKQQDSLTAQLGYDIPSLREDRIHLEMRYTVINLGNNEGTFSLRLDGANEFTRYDEDAVAAAFTAMMQDAPATFGLIQPTPQTIGPGQVYQGSLREDDFHEASLDLDAMGRYGINYGELLINRSEVRPVPQADPSGSVDCSMGCLPEKYSIRPALWEVTPRFNANQPMSFQFLMRVRDDDQRLCEDCTAPFMPDPTTFMPTVPPRM